MLEILLGQLLIILQNVKEPIKLTIKWINMGGGQMIEKTKLLNTRKSLGRDFQEINNC